MSQARAIVILISDRELDRYIKDFVASVLIISIYCIHQRPLAACLTNPEHGVICETRGRPASWNMSAYSVDTERRNL